MATKKTTKKAKKRAVRKSAAAKKAAKVKKSTKEKAPRAVSASQDKAKSAAKAGMSLGKRIFGLVGVALVLFVLFAVVTTYLWPSQHAAARWARTVLPLPAATVNGTWLPVTELERNVASLKQFYTNQDFSSVGIRIDFDTEEGQKRLRLQERDILLKMIEDALVEEAAQEQDITLTEEMVDAEVQRQLDENQNENYIEELLGNLYGWSLEDFKKNYVRGEMLRVKLAAHFDEQAEISEEDRATMTAAKEALGQGMAFEDAVAEYSEGLSADNAGDLGWHTEQTLLPTVYAAVKDLAQGQVSDVVESSYGLHIFQVVSTGKHPETGEQSMQLRHIVLPRETFPIWLTRRAREARIRIPLQDYAWNTDAGTIDITNEALRLFEEEAIAASRAALQNEGTAAQDQQQ